MTYRLVGLMSVVLLLCLAAFALLVHYYQDHLMDEVARTVSEVGRATLRSFEARGGTDVRHESGDGERSAPRFERSGRGVRWVARADAGPGSAGDGPVDEFVVLMHREDGTGYRFRVDEPGATPAESEPAAAGGADELVTVIRVEDVRAEEEPNRFLLRIPTLRSPSPVAPPAERVGQTTGSSSSRRVVHEEIRLQFPTAHYQELFATMRRRFLWVFTGVFVVGTALCAGLATRFTRPIRRLDGAIRRISDGDLDVQVESSGRDEVGRLGRAFNDMTRRLRASRERARELGRREKLSALGRLAAGVAHDVRNPLHSIGLTLRHLEEAGRPEDEARADVFDRALQLMRDEISRLEKLVQNFLAFAKSDRRERVSARFADLVAETARLVEREAARRGVTVEIDAEEGVPEIPVDLESVRASLLNLVLNSFEAMPEGGKLGLHVRHRDGMVRLEVSDTGHGIAEEDRERVFEFAYTTRDGGHGLGLPMVHHVVEEEHGGRVFLETRPGVGTRVSLAFPVGGRRPGGAA